ncbi:COX15/CtaA family protein [Virgibacillus sediminis]|uniref:Heme A synthase n=1 Tax=Virgibacillus sediminis TaxID=202260 RepID=A0ABV7AAU9_9BACI
MKILKWLSVLATLGMVFVLTGGALVTKTGSADGCGDSWPLCHGEIIPSEITPELVIELSHRLVSGSMGIIVVILAVLAWKKIGHVREVKLLSFLSVFFLVAQALIGAAAVVWEQNDFVLAIHFGISLISFASILLLTLLVFEVDKKFDAKSLFIKKKHRMEIYALSIYTFLVVYSGALVRHTEANLVCGSWPFCNNTAPLDLANYSLEQWIQMGHRLAAGILFILALTASLRLISNYKHSSVMRGGWILILALISLQVITGALIILTMLNLGIALLHALIISCFFGLLSYFILLSSRSAKYEREQ